MIDLAVLRDRLSVVFPQLSFEMVELEHSETREHHPALAIEAVERQKDHVYRMTITTMEGCVHFFVHIHGVSKDLTTQGAHHFECLRAVVNASHFRYAASVSVYGDLQIVTAPPPPKAPLLRDVNADVDSAPAIRAALRGAVDRGDTSLPSWLAAALSRDIVDASTREALIDFSELVEWPAEHRPQLCAALLKQALVLRDGRPAGYDRCLSVALRTVARVAALEAGAEFVGFLRAGDPPRTKQAALVAVRILFSSSPPSLEQPVLWARLQQMLEKYLDAEFVSSVEVGALALNTIVAAVASGLPQLPNFGDVANACLPPLLRWQLVDALHELQQDWRLVESVAVPTGAAQHLLTFMSKIEV